MPELPVRILLVDDHPENLAALEATLTSPDYELVAARSGAEALRRVLYEDFALILLDVVMPGMDGLEVTRLIKSRERTRHIPVILLTAGGGDAATQGYEVGAVDYLPKPLIPEVVRAKVAVFAELERRAVEIRRQAQALRQAEARARALELAEIRRGERLRYENLADAVPHVVFTTTSEGEVDFLNERWRELTGTRPEDSLGGRWALRVHPDDAGPLLSAFEAARREGSRLRVECRLRDSGGAYRWHLCQAAPEKGPTGETIAWLGTYTDVDREKRAEALREEFLALAAHELRTPVQALQLAHDGMVRAAAREPLPAPLAERLGAARRQVERLAGLVETLVDVTTPASEPFEIELGEADLGELTRRVVSRLAPVAERQGCEVRVDADEPVRGRWDGRRLEQALASLLSNALKFGAKKPVTIGVRSDGDLAKIRVEDRGIGIEKEKLRSIFDRFERGVSPRFYGGLGLGLHLAARIVSAHGGRIVAESEPGEGAAFTVELPLAPPGAG